MLENLGGTGERSDDVRITEEAGTMVPMMTLPVLLTT